MIEVRYLDQAYECARAVKGANYVRLYDANNIQIVAFEEVSDFSAFTIAGGSWEKGKSTQRVAAEATREGNSFVLIIQERAIVEDGLFISFVAPTDSKGISSIIIDGKQYSFVDAINREVGEASNCFAAGAKLEIILSVTDDASNAYLQNGATNAYLEETFQVKTKKLRPTNIMSMQDRIPFYSEENDNDRSITVEQLQEILGVTTATINVIACEGAEVICTDGEHTLTGIGSTKFASLPMGVWTVTATHEGLTATEEVTILANIQYNVDLRTLETLYELESPKKWRYFAGETFEPAGIYVQAIYTDGTTENVSDDCTFTPMILTADTIVVTALYSKAGITRALDIPITIRQMTGIAITAAPIKTAYIYGEEFDPTGMAVTAIYDDKSTRVVTGWTYSPTSKLTLSTTSILVAYEENGVSVTTNLAITVANPVVSLEVTTPPDNITYFTNDQFNSAGMVVTGTCADGSKKRITDYVVTPATITAETAEITIAHTSEGGGYCWCTYPIDVIAVSYVLQDNSWEVIRMVSDAGKAASYWSVGDTKSVTLSGSCVGGDYNDITMDAYILGFDHNAEVEGSNRIHFQLGKIEGVSASLTSKLGGYEFAINPDGGTYPDWESSSMRKTVLGNRSLPTEPYKNSVMAMLPQDLRSVMKSVVKLSYNNDNGYSGRPPQDTHTDFLFLPSVFEIFGSVKNAVGSGEASNQQYAYFAAGNSVLKQSQELAGNVKWWTRSKATPGAYDFVIVNTLGESAAQSHGLGAGISPCFCV